jgi:hypothetical protein
MIRHSCVGRNSLFPLELVDYRLRGNDEFLKHTNFEQILHKQNYRISVFGA